MTQPEFQKLMVIIESIFEKVRLFMEGSRKKGTEDKTMQMWYQILRDKSFNSALNAVTELNLQESQPRFADGFLRRIRTMSKPEQTLNAPRFGGQITYKCAACQDSGFIMAPACGQDLKRIHNLYGENYPHTNIAYICDHSKANQPRPDDGPSPEEVNAAEEKLSRTELGRNLLNKIREACGKEKLVFDTEGI